ncbi:MAG: molybdopterin molybdotransferase MoeA, partial [Chitinophagales bacterium]
MISVSQAVSIIQDHLKGRIIESAPVANVFRHVLATDIISPINLPPFDNSAMDGYAIQYADLNKGPLEVIDSIAAGDNKNAAVTPGKAARIFTGAKMPAGADTVVMQEHVQVNDNKITIHNTEIQKGSNVRLKGVQIQRGEIALHTNTILNPAAIGFIASMGIQSVEVFRKPKIKILVTGNELLQAGEMLQDGKIFESNAVMLQAALHDIGIAIDAVYYIKDDKAALIQHLEKLHADCDVIIITGGVSVGDHDIVNQSKANAHFTTFFHKVKQKPGKPFLFGQYRNTTVFGLPGNPAAVLSCYYVYILPWMQYFCGLPITHTSMQL